MKLPWNKERICLIHCHPSKDSFNRALADSYEKGAKIGGHQTKRFDLYEMSFDPVLKHDAQGNPQALELDLQGLRDSIEWSTHLVLVFPLWWFGLPSMLKGVFDRILSPGWAFEFNGPFSWQKLLKGRSARIIYTMDSPPVVARCLVGNPIDESLKRGTLSFVGFHPIGITPIGPVKFSNGLIRGFWKYEIESLGRKAE